MYGSGAESLQRRVDEMHHVYIRRGRHDSANCHPAVCKISQAHFILEIELTDTLT